MKKLRQWFRNKRHAYYQKQMLYYREAYYAAGSHSDSERSAFLYMEYLKYKKKFEKLEK